VEAGPPQDVPPDTPVVLEPGPYVLAAEKPGRYPTRYPLFLSHGEEARIRVPLPEASLVPEGFAFVPEGIVRVGTADAEGMRLSLAAEPEHPVHMDAFLIGRYEVTFGQYLDFLRAQTPSVRAEHTPRALTLEMAFDEQGVPRLTLDQTTVRGGELLCRPKRSKRRCQDWLRLPVAGVSPGDARAYAGWLSATRIPDARLCSGREWERAARGADERLYPQGDVIQTGDANTLDTYDRDADQVGADEVGSYPRDRSPFGVFDLGGNVAEWVSEGEGRDAARGGLWVEPYLRSRIAQRRPLFEAHDSFYGFRVCAPAPGL
jgi:formylglycine-generating enzyme required for sulfatase activity